MKNIVYFIILSVLISCAKKVEPLFLKRTKIEMSTINLESIQEKLIYIDSVFENFRYVKLETTSESLIGNYDKIKIVNDTIFILESSNSQQCIFAFNRKGKFLFKIDKKGRGPGEYTSIDDFYIEDTLNYIGVLSNSKILKYNFEGNFIGDLNFKNSFIRDVVFSNNNLFFRKKSVCETESCYSFAKVDAENGSVFYEDYPEHQDISHIPLNKGTYLASNSKNVYANFLYNDTIYLANDKFLEPKFLIDFGGYKLPENLFDEITSKKGGVFKGLTRYNDFVGLGLSKFSISKDYIFLLFDKGMQTFTALYSIKTKKIRIFNGSHYQKNIIKGSGFSFVKENTFCSVFNVEEALRIKNEDEVDGILSSEKNIKFDKRRIDKYNFLKGFKSGDNNILVLFDIKKF